MAKSGSELKLICITSKEIMKAYGGNRGKFGAQCGHAFLHSFWDAEDKFPKRAEEYKFSDSAKKVVLVTETTEEFLALEDKYYNKFGTTVVRDSGLTIFSEPTVTCIGIGPIKDEECGEDLNSLKVLL
jgi:peptidyl-tRNA hydrolase